MGKSSPAAPPAPDYAAAAKETASGNLDAARYATQANRVNQYTPYGSLTYNNNQTLDQARYDRDMADYNAANSKGTWVAPTEGTYSYDGGDSGTSSYMPGNAGYWSGAASNGKAAPNQKDYMQDNWTQTETLDPQIQAALDSQIAIQKGRSDQANSMMGSVRDQYSTAFDPTRLSEYLGGVGAVQNDDLGRAGDFNTNAQFSSQIGDAGSTDMSALAQNGQFSTGSTVNTDAQGAQGGTAALNQYLGSFGQNGSGVNTNAPAYTGDRANQYSRAAFDSQYGLLSGDLNSREERLRNSLALQGLSPGSEANSSSMNEFEDARSRQLNALANSSVLAGNQMSNADYVSQLAGFGAGNNAVGQKFGQDLSQFTTNLGARQAENAARGQQFGQSLQTFQAGNAAQGQRYAQDQGTYGTNMQANMANATLQQMTNAAQQQAFQQQLSRAQFGNDANAQQAALDAMKYDNQLRGLTTNAGLQAAGNQAQNQQYAQALQNYGTNWQQEQTLRNMPLNEMNALLTGQQVQNPQFQGYAQQGQTNGADYLGAVGQQANYNQGVYNAGAANAAQGNASTASAVGSAAAIAAMFF